MNEPLQLPPTEDSRGDVTIRDRLRSALDYAQIFTHLEDFTRGVVDTRQILFYLSGATLALILAILGVEAKQLHS